MTITEAIQNAAARHGIDAQEVLGPKRYPELVAARWEAWANAHASGHTFAAIARATGRDHTSVMHGVRRHNERKAK
jgi:chromosomal replication initiation ATPase DnaA